MTENELRNEVVRQARSWLGRKEADGSHREIIDLYNSIQPLPRGYRLGYDEPWCAAFVSACAQAWGLTEILFPECGCGPMLERYREAGRWTERDDYRPRPGDLIFYDWQDPGEGDCLGAPDHVGLVAGLDGKRLTLIEGNCGDAVCCLYRDLDSRFIRGYGLPDYASVAAATEAAPVAAQAAEPPADKTEEVPRCTVELPLLREGSLGGFVRAAQALLVLRGCRVGPDGADGDFGPRTLAALLTFQRRRGLEPDGILGPASWSALLRG